MENLKSQELLALVNTLKRQLDQLMRSETSVHQIEVDIVKETLRKLYDAVSIDFVQQPLVEKQVEESNLAEQSQIADEEAEELIQNSEKEFKLLFDFDNEPQLQTQSDDLPKATNLNFNPIEEPVIEDEIIVEELIIAENIDVFEEEIKFDVDKIEPVVEEIIIAPKSNSEIKSPIPTTKLTEKILGENIIKNPIDSLRKHIGINDKFQFINELFGGKMKIYNENIAALDEINNRDEAYKIIDQLKMELSWDEESKIFEHFMGYISRRFS